MCYKKREYEVVGGLAELDGMRGVMINIRCTGVQIFQRIKKKTPRSWQYSVGFLCMCVKDCAYEKALVADVVQVFHCMSISSKSV